MTPSWRLGWPAFWMWLWQNGPSLHSLRRPGEVKEPCSTSSTLLSPLFHFVLPVASCCCWFVVGGCIGLKTCTSKKVLFPLVPELLGLNVQPSLVLNVRASEGKPLPSQRLESWLNGHNRANLGEELSGDIPKAVMPDRQEGTFWGSAMYGWQRRQHHTGSGKGVRLAANHTWCTKHPGKPVCIGWIHTRQWEWLSAKRMPPSNLLDPWQPVVMMTTSAL